MPRSVATAQSFSAGLLPDPQFSFSYQFLLAGPAHTASAMAGLTQDVLSILTRPVRKSAATANEQRVRLNLLWQEWQVVSLARTFFVVQLPLVLLAVPSVYALLSGRTFRRSERRS